MGNTSAGESRDPVIPYDGKPYPVTVKMKVGRNSFCGVGDSKKNISLVCTKIGAQIKNIFRRNSHQFKCFDSQDPLQPASSSSFIPISMLKVALSVYFICLWA